MVNDDGHENNDEFVERRNRHNSPNDEHEQRRLQVVARLIQNHLPPPPPPPQPLPPLPARFILEVYQPIIVQAQQPFHLRIMPNPFSLPLSPPLTPPPPPLPPPSPPPSSPSPIPATPPSPPPPIPINIRPLGVPLMYIHSFWLRIRENSHLQYNGLFKNELLKSSEQQNWFRKRLAPPSISKVRIKQQKELKMCSSKFVSKCQKNTSTFSKSHSVSPPAADVNGLQNYDCHSYDFKPQPTTKAAACQPKWHRMNYWGKNNRLRQRKCNCKMMLVDLEFLHDNMNPPQVENIIEAQEREGDEEDEQDEENIEEEEGLQLEIFRDDDEDDSNDDHNFLAMKHSL